MRRSYVYTYGLLAVIIIAMIVYLVMRGSGPVSAPTVSGQGQTTGPITFACAENKTIDATFNNMENGTSTVSLKLSDGRSMTLPQTISGSGARYANADETFVFWNKGNTAFVEEGNTNVNNPPMTYKNCVALAPDASGQLSKWYVDPQGKFSIRYPDGYAADAKYQYTALGPGKEIPGVKFTIPESMTKDTNLASDSYLSVETYSPKSGALKTCQPSYFLDGTSGSQEITDGSTTYLLASTTGAAAGNRYEETVYTLTGTNRCMAVRYFIHYGVIENYPAGTVHEFDKVALLQQFDSIRRSLVIGQ